MLDIPTATTGAKAGTRTPEQRQKFLSRQPTGAYAPPEEGGLGTQPGSSSLTAQGPGMTSLNTSATSTSTNPWMGYNEYFAGTPEALDTTAPPGEDPQKYANQYNEYKAGLPLIYQDLINYGIGPEQVASGQVNNILRGNMKEQIPTDPAQAMAIYGSTRNAAVGAPGGPTRAGGPLSGGIGTGSQHSIAPEVMNRMWR